MNSNTELIALVIGILMPMAISATKQAKLNKWWNLLIAVVTCAAAGTITVWARGELQWTNFATVATTIFVASQAMYAAFWRDSLDDAWNQATSFLK